jgi:acylglycerol lipase
MFCALPLNIDTQFRGWGRTVKTKKDRGNTGDTAVVLSDMHAFITSTAAYAESINIPLFLVGHSMGGGQSLTYILHPESPYHSATKPTLSGVLVWSPLITLDPSSQPWKITIIAGRIAARILPRWQRYTPLDPSLISRNESVIEDFKTDELCHDTGTLEGLKGMLDRGLWLNEAGVEVYENAGLLPLWIGHGVEDKITSFEGTKAFVKRLGGKGDVTFVEYEGAYHTLHAELPETTRKFTKDVTDWLLAKCPSAPASNEGVSGMGAGEVEEQNDASDSGKKSTETETSKAKL